jgi:hypothetical protein
VIEATPLLSGQEERFNLASLAMEADRRNHVFVVIAPAFIAVASAVLLGEGYAVAAETGTSVSPVIWVTLAVVVAIGVVFALAVRKLKSPVAIVVGPTGVVFDYPGGVSRQAKWNDPRLRLWLLDQRGAKKPRPVAASDFGCRFDSARLVPGYFSPISKEVYDRILDWAHELELPVTSHPLQVGRGFRRDVTVHRIRRPSPRVVQ